MFLKSISLLALLLFFGCRDIDEFIPDENDPGEESGLVVASAGGWVEDMDGNALVNVMTRFGSGQGSTDANGVFMIQHVEVPDFYAPLVVEQAGYFPCYRTFQTEESNTQTFRLQLRDHQYSAFYQSTEVATISGQNNLQLNMPGNALVDQSGAFFNGIYRLAFEWIEQPSAFPPLEIPVSFLGRTVEGQVLRLNPAALFLMDFRSESGAQLALHSGQTINIQWPIPNGLTVTGTEVPLWALDQSTGLWTSAEPATVNGDLLQAQIDRSTYWAVGDALPAVRMSTTIQDNDGDPISNMRWELRETVSDQLLSAGYTGGSGRVLGWVPANEQVELRLYNDCSDPILTQPLGALGQSLDLPAVALDVFASIPIRLQGNIVDCNNAPIPLGYLKLHFSDHAVILFSEPNGKIDTWIADCGEDLLLGTPANLITQEVGDTSQLQVAGTINFGSLPVCLASQEFLSFNFDGADFLGIAPSAYKEAGYTYIEEASVNMYLVIPDTMVGTSQFDAAFTQIQGYHSGNIASSEIATTITAYGDIGDYIIGTFGGTFSDTSGVSHSIMGSYKVILEE